MRLQSSPCVLSYVFYATKRLSPLGLVRATCTAEEHNQIECQLNEKPRQSRAGEPTWPLSLSLHLSPPALPCLCPARVGGAILHSALFRLCTTQGAMLGLEVPSCQRIVRIAGVLPPLLHNSSSRCLKCVLSRSHAVLLPPDASSD